MYWKICFYCIYVVNHSFFCNWSFALQDKDPASLAYYQNLAAAQQAQKLAYSQQAAYQQQQQSLYVQQQQQLYLQQLQGYYPPPPQAPPFQPGQNVLVLVSIVKIEFTKYTVYFVLTGGLNRDLFLSSTCNYLWLLLCIYKILFFLKCLIIL